MVPLPHIIQPFPHPRRISSRCLRGHAGTCAKSTFFRFLALSPPLNPEFLAELLAPNSSDLQLFHPYPTYSITQASYENKIQVIYHFLSHIATLHRLPVIFRQVSLRPRGPPVESGDCVPSSCRTITTSSKPRESIKSGVGIHGKPSNFFCQRSS